MAAAPPSPRLPKAHCDGGGAPVSLFLNTDLGTHLALLVAPDTTIRGLKSLVAAEHADAFPDLGPVAVNSFQVRRKGILYHLSDSMTVTSAFTRIKGGCFLHVKMAEGAAAARCSGDAAAINGRRPSDGCLGLYVEGHVQELPATTSEIPSDVLTQRLEGGRDAAALNNVRAHDALPNCISLRSSSHLNIEIKNNETIGGVNDTDAGYYPVINNEKSSMPMENVDKSSDQINTSHILEEVHATKEDIMHGVGDRDVDAGVSDNKQVRIEEQILEEMHAMDNLSQENEQNRSTTCSFDISAADTFRINNEPETRDGTKSSRAPPETETTTHGEPLNTSLETHDASHEESIQLENTSSVEKKKKRKKHRLAPSKAASAQEITEISAGAVKISKSTGDNACDIELTGRDVMKESGLPLSSAELNVGNEGGKHFVSDAQASTDLLSEQEKLDRAAVYSTVEDVVSQGKVTKESSAHQDGGDKHEERKQLNEGSHDKGVAEASNIEKDGKSTDVLEKQTNDNTFREKKRKKAKKVSSVDMAPTDATGEKEMHGHRENAAKSDIVSTEREIVHGPSMQQISNNVTENRSDHGKKKKKRIRHSESSKDVDPSQDLTKSSGFAASESSIQIQCTVAAPLEAKQTTVGKIGATVDHKKLGGSQDIEALNLIEEVLAELRSKDSLSTALDGDLLTGQTHLGINQNALEAPKSSGDKVGLSAALPPKCPAAIHSDAPASSPRHKKSKRKKLKVLSTTIDSSHRSNIESEEDANTELKESDKTTDHKDSLSGDVVAQADDTLKATKRQRKKPLKHVPIDNGKTSDEQASQFAAMGLKEVNAAQTDFVQGGSTIDIPLSTVGKLEQKGRRSSEARTPKIQKTNQIHGLDSHLVKESQYDYETDTIGTHGKPNAAGPSTESPMAQKDVTALKSTSPVAQKEKKKSSSSEIQNHSALEHGSDADLVNSRTEEDLISPKSPADAVKPNDQIMVHPASDEINFLDHFSSSKMNDPSVSTENRQNNEDGTLREMKNKKNKRKMGTGSIEPNDVLESPLLTNKTSLTGHSGTSKAVAPSVAEESMNKEANVMNGKEKKRKSKANVEVASAEKENPTNNQGINIGTQESHLSVVQKGRMGLDSGKERLPEESHHPLEKKLQRSDVDGYLNNVPTDRDHVHITREMRRSTSQTKPHAKSRNNDESIKGRVAPNPNTVNNLVKDFSMSPPASSDSTVGTPQNANRYRVAVRKIPSKRSEQTSEKSKKESMKVGSGAIFNDAISEGSDDELETNNKKVLDNSSTSADSGISSAASDESEVPDDDGTISLSQKSLKDGLRIGSILRGSSSYKKVRQKQAEQLDDDILVPDSQPDA